MVTYFTFPMLCPILNLKVLIMRYHTCCLKRQEQTHTDTQFTFHMRHVLLSFRDKITNKLSVSQWIIHRRQLLVLLVFYWHKSYQASTVHYHRKRCGKHLPVNVVVKNNNNSSSRSRSNGEGCCIGWRSIVDECSYDEVPTLGEADRVWCKKLFQQVIPRHKFLRETCYTCYGGERATDAFLRMKLSILS